MSFDEKPAPEIVIIRRGGSSDDHGHHGGAWKIAYADFMTAMMALFLVMWLVNAADTKTLNQVATYFNPITLTDQTTAERGVKEMKQGGSGKETERQPKSQNAEKQGSPKNDIGRVNDSEEGLFSDPYDVLDKLAKRAARAPLPTSQDGIRQDAAGRMSGGEAFRDPFDPDFRFNSNTDDQKSSEIRPRFEPPPNAAEGDKPQGKKPEELKSGEHKSTAPLGVSPDDLVEDKPKDQAEKKQAADAKAGDQPIPEAVKKEADQIETALQKAVAGTGFDKLPEIAVQKTPEGVLISLTDNSDFEMFALSSAEPKPETVVLMEKLAEVLKKEPGNLIIRGYTDARPFRTKTYDNWRLSTARAHIAHYMLRRGGLEKQRFERIEGYADRDLKVPSDPNAAQNRRIEILVRPAKA